ncbi:hypothetical protein GWI33_005273 [Rhynchophorus ferrugineus]|uniref:Uncharacterized protein n=1 Tax=Rhynchophorus ferrugineus TaxID=354439 RepID=A0A834MER9_RHYFE|nr:hypothetical protein GWI33_005273 [Rhynchophorus ferrugineus]
MFEGSLAGGPDPSPVKTRQNRDEHPTRVDPEARPVGISRLASVDPVGKSGNVAHVDVCVCVLPNSRRAPPPSVPIPFRRSTSYHAIVDEASAAHKSNQFSADLLRHRTPRKVTEPRPCHSYRSDNVQLPVRQRVVRDVSFSATVVPVNSISRRGVVLFMQSANRPPKSMQPPDGCIARKPSSDLEIDLALGGGDGGRGNTAPRSREEKKN